MAPVNPDGYRIKRPSLTEKIYQSDVVISLNRFGEIEVLKNRYGNPGKIQADEIVNVLSLMLVKKLFNNRLKMFQEGMRNSIIKAINKIIKEGSTDNDTI